MTLHERILALYLVFSVCGVHHVCLAEKVVIDVGRQIVVPTREVVTPHIPWANPLAGHKLRILFMGRREKMREVVEFAQRLEMKYEFWAAGGTHNVESDSEIIGTTYLRGGFYKGDALGDKIKRLKRLLHGPDYDLIVIGARLDWRQLPLFAKYEILRRVKNGTGLINIGKSSNADEYLAAATKKAIPVPEAVAAGVPWQALPVFKAHKHTNDFLKSTLIARQFGKGRIITLTGYGITSRHLISPGFTAWPLESTGAWAQHWNGRTEEYKKGFPEFTMPIKEFRRLDYDYNLAFLIKVMLFAVNRLPQVTVEKNGVVREVARDKLTEIRFSLESIANHVLSPLTAEFALRNRDNRILATWHMDGLTVKPGNGSLAFPVSNVPAGEYFADIRIERNGKVLTFGSVALRVTSRASIAAVDLSSDHFRKQDAITGEVRIEAGDKAAGDLMLVVRQKDTLGRLVRVETVALTGGETTVPLKLQPIGNPVTVYQYLTIDLVGGEQVFDRKRALYSFSNLYITDTIRIGAWQRMQISYIGWHVYDQLYGIGFDHVGSFALDHSWNYYGVGPNSSFVMGRHEIPVLSNLRFVPQLARITDAGIAAYADKTYLGLHGVRKLEVEKGVRAPCLNEPKYNEFMENRARELVGYHRNISSTQYMFNQEMSFTQVGNRKYKGDSELCYSPWCKQYFHNYLRKTYGTIAALNTEYVSDYKDFGEVEPVKLDRAAMNRRLWPLWADFRMAMESSYSDFFVRLTKTMQSIQPEVRAGDDWANGTGFRSLDAFDMWKMTRSQRITQPKPHEDINQLWVDFLRDSPGSLIGFGAYWGPSSGRGKVFSRYMPWNELFRGCNYFYTYWGDTGATTLAHDLSMYDDLKILMQEYAELKRGIGKMIHEARRDHNGVALLYSIASIHHWQLSHSDVTSGRDYYRGGMQHQYRAWIAMLIDAVGTFRFVSYQQLAEGKLMKDRFKLLVLPWSQALSPAEIEQIKMFVKNGGTVLADMRPGVSDGHCKSYEASPLDEVFGIAQNTGSTELKSEWVKTPFGRHKEPAHLGRLETDPSLKLVGGKPAGVAGDSVPVLITNRYGKGKAILLNFGLGGYVLGATYKIPRTVHAPKILSLVKPLIRGTGVRPPVGLSPELDRLHCYVRRSGSLTYLCLMQDLPAPIQDYAAGIAQPLMTRKTTVTYEKPAHVYASRAGRYLGHSDRADVYITPGVGKVLALLPYRVTAVNVKAPASVTQGAELRYEVTLDATDDPGKHVMHIEVTDPDRNKVHHYSKNLDCIGGKCSGVFTLALNETPGTYRLMATDAATGVAGAAMFKVQGR